MTINAELLKQKDLLEKQHNIINSLEGALNQVLLKREISASHHTGGTVDAQKSQISEIIEYHNNLILDNTCRLESLLLAIDLDR
jgi:hypothetical protein